MFSVTSFVKNSHRSLNSFIHSFIYLNQATRPIRRETRT